MQKDTLKRETPKANFKANYLGKMFRITHRNVD